MIVILSDFGNSEYLGIMKGVIYSICDAPRIIDLCNNINHQNIKEGAWILLKSYRHFPKSTIFLCVVDPGVGGKRESIAVRTKNYFFVGPDNGLMYPAIIEDGIIEIRRLNTEFASKTFHGRDVFAKVSALLENNNTINSLGMKSNVNVKLEFYKNGREGEVVRIDNFGNIITNLEHTGKKTYSVFLPEKKIELRLKFFDTYEKASDDLFLIEGSANTLEISVKNGNANHLLRVNFGDKIEIK